MLTQLGIGICAINVAKWLGAEIYVTVSNEDKASFLTREFGIPRNRIFNSRDNSFLKDILDATDGSGVDLVLNTLSGELLSASWKCVAPEGAMVELGRRDSKFYSPLIRSMQSHSEVVIEMSTASPLKLTQPVLYISGPETKYASNAN